MQKIVKNTVRKKMKHGNSMKKKIKNDDRTKRKTKNHDKRKKIIHEDNRMRRKGKNGITVKRRIKNGKTEEGANTIVDGVYIYFFININFIIFYSLFNTGTNTLWLTVVPVNRFCLIDLLTFS